MVLHSGHSAIPSPYFWPESAPKSNFGREIFFSSAMRCASRVDVVMRFMGITSAYGRRLFGPALSDDPCAGDSVAAISDYTGFHNFRLLSCSVSAICICRSRAKIKLLKTLIQEVAS